MSSTYQTIISKSQIEEEMERVGREDDLSVGSYNCSPRPPLWGQNTIVSTVFHFRFIWYFMVLVSERPSSRRGPPRWLMLLPTCLVGALCSWFEYSSCSPFPYSWDFDNGMGLYGPICICWAVGWYWLLCFKRWASFLFCILGVVLGYSITRQFQSSYWPKKFKAIYSSKTKVKTFHRGFV